MTQYDVLELFKERAEKLDVLQASQSDIILRLAQLLADSREYMSKENFEELVQIGAVMYKEGQGQFRARSELATLMKTSVQEQDKEDKG